MPKFFVSPDKITGDKIIIDTSDVAHIKRVLRLNTGDEISVCDSSGRDFCARITEICAESIICTILSESSNETEPNINVTIYQALPKASKMEYIIQKCVELGVSKIVPCALSRCVVKLDKKDSQKKTARWQKIADEAAKQCGRGILPEISDVYSFRDAAESMKQDDLCFVPYECETNNCLKNLLTSHKNSKNVSFMIGPEGGFTPEEIEFLKSENIPPITLGPRILRTETAGMATLSMVMYEIGDINK